MGTQTQVLDTFKTEHLKADLKGRFVRGGLVALTSQSAQFLLSSTSAVVLARLLTPADFGLVAMVTAITGLGQAFADLGLSEATIQREEISHKQVSTLFWINVGIGAALMLITIVLAPVVAWFYREPRVRNIASVVSLTFLIGGLRVQHDALLKRQMRFSSLAVRDITAGVLAVPIAITMAWRGAGYWAVVALPLVANLIQMTLSWVMAKWIPGLPRRGANVRSLVAFGSNVAASYLICNAMRSSDTVLIGWRWGAGPLGLYSRAYNLLLLPVRQLGAPARSVAVPAFSRTQDDAERVGRYYLRTVNLMMWISAPVFAFLFVTAEPIIVLTLGRQWREAAPVFRILSISALGQLLFDSVIWLFVSRGQSKRLLNLFLVLAPITVGSFVVGLPFGIKGVALSGSLVLTAVFPWILKRAFCGTTLTLRRMGEAIAAPVLLCLAAILLAEITLHAAALEGILPQLVTTAICFGVAFTVSIALPAVRREFQSVVEIGQSVYSKWEGQRSS